MSDDGAGLARWRRLDVPGRDEALLGRLPSGWRLRGKAWFTDGEPCELEYQVDCDARWRTLSARVSGRIGARDVDLVVTAEPDHRWSLDGVEAPQVAGCIDVDLSFTPATNLLPIRRLALAIGQEAEVPAAWLSFPALELELIVQRYRRVDARTYRYASDDGRFVRELEVDENGFVVRYGDQWRAESP